MATAFNWKLFLIVLAACVFGSFALLPYGSALAAAGGAEPQTLTLQLAILVLLQTFMVFGLAAGIGLLLAQRIGLGLPILAAALRREPVGKSIREMLPVSVLLGTLAGVLIIVLDRFVFQPAMTAGLGQKAAALTAAATAPGPWKGFLASFYGGINEEVLLRLFLMTLLAWLAHFISKTAAGRPTTAALWITNVLAAVVFGVLHLPTVALLVPLTPMVLFRTILLNSLGGVIFGYLYMKRGLEAAMVAHFSADIVLHVIFGI